MKIRALIDENNGRWKEDLIREVFSPRDVMHKDEFNNQEYDYLISKTIRAKISFFCPTTMKLFFSRQPTNGSTSIKSFRYSSLLQHSCYLCYISSRN